MQPWRAGGGLIGCRAAHHTGPHDSERQLATPNDRLLRFAPAPSVFVDEPGRIVVESLRVWARSCAHLGAESRGTAWRHLRPGRRWAAGEDLHIEVAHAAPDHAAAGREEA